jgi:hypothetical protein
MFRLSRQLGIDVFGPAVLIFQIIRWLANVNHQYGLVPTEGWG